MPYCPKVAPTVHVQTGGLDYVEVKGNHSVYVSKPEEVAALFQTAAKGVKLTAN